MKSFIKLCLTFLLLVFLHTNCATIIGGSRYYANVQVPGYPDAAIEYKGEQKGKGNAHFKAPRKEVNTFQVTIKHDGCETEIKRFHQRDFRTWSFIGTLIGWTGSVQGIPIPWGVIVDGSTGAWWRPDVNEPGVSKINRKHYTYTIEYSGCSTVNSVELIEPAEIISKDSLNIVINSNENSAGKESMSAEEFDVINIE